MNLEGILKEYSFEIDLEFFAECVALSAFFHFLDIIYKLFCCLECSGM